MPDPFQPTHLIQQPTDALRALLTSFGVVTPPALWYLDPIVKAVSIIDSRVSLQSISTPEIWTLRSSAGELVNPAANTRWFDTGQLAAGTFSFHIIAAQSAQQQHRIKHRNAADAADINQVLVATSANDPIIDMRFIIKTALNERLVFENNAAPGAGVLCQAVAWSVQL